MFLKNVFKNSISKIDVLFIVIFSLTPLCSFLIPGNFFLEHSLLILTPLFFFFSLSYFENIGRYVRNLVISVFACWTVVTLLILIKDDEGVGYLIIFLIFFAKILIESAVLAYLLAFVYQKVTITLTSKKSSNRVNVIIAVILAVFIGGKYSYETASHTLLSDELRKKGKLLNKISESYGVDWTSDLNTQKAIQIGIFDSIYSVTNNTISHGYGGSIEILTDTRGVSVIYHDIPSKEIAFQFYYTLMSGLTDTYVDEKSTKTITHSKEIEKRKRELCYTGKKSVTVRYTTAFGNLKK